MYACSWFQLMFDSQPMLIIITLHAMITLMIQDQKLYMIDYFVLA